MATDKKKDIDPKLLQLLQSLSESRDKLYEYSSDMESLKDKLFKLFPDSNDFRNRSMLDEKLKTAASFYSSLLGVRQEINKSIINEMDIRRKLENDDDDSKTTIDIRKVIEELDKKGFKRQIIGTKEKVKADQSKESNLTNIPEEKSKGNIEHV